MAKIQPLDKTVVTEFKIHVADIHMRSRQMNGAQACRVSRDGAFTQGDQNITTTQRVVLNNVMKMLAISSWKDVFISLKNETGTIENIPCTGLFIMYGQFEEVTIRAQAEGDPIRISYVFA